MAHHYDEDRERGPLHMFKPKKEEKPTPNRQKFASLVGKLNPLEADYAAQVTLLNSQYNRREELMKRLGDCLTPHDATKVMKELDCKVEDVDSLLAALRAAVERWVVDNR